MADKTTPADMAAELRALAEALWEEGGHNYKARRLERIADALAVLPVSEDDDLPIIGEVERRLVHVLGEHVAVVSDGTTYCDVARMVMRELKGMGVLHPAFVVDSPVSGAAIAARVSELEALGGDQ